MEVVSGHVAFRVVDAAIVPARVLMEGLIGDFAQFRWRRNRKMIHKAINN